MIKLLKEKNGSGWWIEVWNEYSGDKPLLSQQLAVTAEEVIDLSNQINELLVIKQRCPKCLEPMVEKRKHFWQCPVHKDLSMSKG